ncbi:MAG TPA: Vms1/Ankzf1 family peptidyl-tRNA hydrolase [Pyrinomonadaceae bacterium]|nr:Vms1/Ankzf1 family peptidyl-tRNA hydrolase [Pyrinomonadaceae bacterium]
MPLNETMDKLAAFEPTDLPVISLYLNAQANQHGRDNFDSFIRKEFKAKSETFPLRSPARLSFEKDTERINAYLKNLRPSANGVAIFACAGSDNFFEALELDAPFPDHRLYVYHQPHLYPLARLSDQYPRYAALIADTNSARIYVFGIGKKLREDMVRNQNVNRTQLGGWSQARYQRHIEKYYLNHAKEIVDELDKTVREEDIKHIVLAGDEVILPVLREQFPPHLRDKVIDILRLDIRTPENEVAKQTLEALRAYDAKTDIERVEHLTDEYRSGGLAVVGVHDTLAALSAGQVDELYLSAQLEEIHSGTEEMGKHLLPHLGDDLALDNENDATHQVKVADELVTRARQTGAGVSFIEDARLLADVGGIGATLRYKV